MSSRVTKILSANDIGDTGGHQAGITVPKTGPMVVFFPRLNAGEPNPRATLRAIDFHTNELFRLEFIYYNKKLLGQGTRNEYRLTGLSKFLKRHNAVVGDILRIEREEDLFWLSIQRLIKEEYSSILTESPVNESWSFGAQIDQDQLDDRFLQEEGGSMLTLSRRYERSRLNRKVAIEFHGRECNVCKFSFDGTYGSLSGGYVEIHHLVPVSQMQGPKPLDPRIDLVPLCANCHRMVHRVWPPVSPERLRQIISSKDSR